VGKRSSKKRAFAGCTPAADNSDLTLLLCLAQIAVVPGWHWQWRNSKWNRIRGVIKRFIDGLDPVGCHDLKRAARETRYVAEPPALLDEEATQCSNHDLHMWDDWDLVSRTARNNG
jgi:hypothetical protein